MLYGVFLSYYKDYQLSSIKQFKSFLDSLCVDYEIIVINNGGVFAGTKLIDSKFILVQGDNTNWEFSGWDRGISAIPHIDEKDSFIFCNDTFCQHNSWGWLTRQEFKLSFRKLCVRNYHNPYLCMSGTSDSFNKEFSVLNFAAKKWFSTYLFFMSASLLLRIKKLSLEESILSDMVELDHSGHIVWGDTVSNDLKQHLSNWIYPLGGKRGWYNSASAGNELKLRKLKTILNEKYISAFSSSIGSDMVEVSTKKILKTKLLHR